MYISPKQVGNGTYTISLDNGEQIPINIEVGESLNSISLTTKDENNIIRYIEHIVEEDDISTLIYVYNYEENTNFDVTLIANDSARSNAISEVSPEIVTPYLSLSQLEDENSFIVSVEDSGTLSLIFTVKGFDIKDFTRETKEIEYTVNIISFNYIERLNVYKTSDGFGEYPAKTTASYANVYSNTYSEDARKLQLNISMQNQNAYLFANPATNKFEASLYDQKYLYFESDALIYKNETAVDYMYFSPVSTNVYTLGGYGTFDTETLTFTAFSNLVNSGSLKLIAHVKQYGKTYSYTININIEIYEIVERVTLQTAISQIEFSTLEREKSLIAYPTNKTATNGEIVAFFVGGEIPIEGTAYRILDEKSISYLVSDGKTSINLKVSEAFVEVAKDYQEEMSGDLVIVAKDWLDNGGNLRSEYQELALHIKIRFANGTLKNRFTIEDAQDLVAIKNNLSAHYQINTTIDVSAVLNQFPLGELKGSIVGTNEYAIITNLVVSTPYEVIGEENYNYYGLFTKIAEGAYLEYIQFNGAFAIDYKEGISNIGLIAAENNGKLINVGAQIGASKVNLQHGNFGGLVGINNGEIIQDFTLFEAADSVTRSTSVKELESAGRYSYANKTPIIGVQMTDFVNVYYLIENYNTDKTRIGGLVGFNEGLIKKIDSYKVSFNGYANYMAYSLIKAQPSNNIEDLRNVSNVYTGALVGEAYVSTDDMIIAGVNTLNEQSKLIFSTYLSYENKSNLKFEAGEGILVGGEVWGYGYVGGVIGNLNNLSSQKEFAGITSRTFIRGQKVGDTTANIALIANIPSVKDRGGLSTAFAIQAVDDGKLGEEASMAILYNGDVIQNYVDDVNKIGFGNFENTIGVLNGFSESSEEPGKPINVFTYNISRQLISIPEGSENIVIRNSSKDNYYGDFVMIATLEGSRVVIAQKTFKKGNDENFSIEAKFANKMTSAQANTVDIYYAYYFQVASLAVEDGNDLTSVQTLLDTYLNKISVFSEIYPFIANGEMVFSSKTTDVLTIDQMGKITIKKSGLALISASSVLNTNNALNFYINVVNYFNPESEIENELRNSIIFNDASASSIPVDVSNIELRGNNSAELFVRARYNLNLEIEEDVDFFADKFGLVEFKNIVFNLAENADVTALVEEVTGKLEINVEGQNIIVRKNSETIEGSYDLVITPIIRLVVEGESGAVYTAEVNKKLTSTVVNYKLGAIGISNKNYNTVPLQTSKTISDEITINSTDENELEPLYYIAGLDGKTMQGSVKGIDYQLQDSNYLFKVDTNRIENAKAVGNGIFEHKFKMLISINTQSTVYTERYNKEIYGQYLLYIQPQSNSDFSICVKIDFERTEISSVVIDNYKSIDEIDGSGLSTTSDFAYPGETGLLQITVTPEDSDYDYVLIENDVQNYLGGNATSTFSLLSRKSNPDSEGLFKSGTIVGSLTSKGIKLTQDEIIKEYSASDVVDYNGVIYVKYNMSSRNVTDLSTSKINVTFFKDGQEIYPTYKNLTVKVQDYVAIEIDGKEGVANQNGYYMSYNVARGMKYKLNINSFGFSKDNIEIKSSNSTLGAVTKENGEYYLTITAGAVDYSDANEVFELIIEAVENEGEKVRQAASKTKITIFEYVLNYKYDLDKDKDIVAGAGNGVVNVQVGSQIGLEVDLRDFVEYNHTISSVVDSIEIFMKELNEKGQWYAFTNLISNEQPDYTKAPEYDLNEIIDINNSKRMIYSVSKDIKNSNYYFNSEGLEVTPVRTHIPQEEFYYFGYKGQFKEENGIYIYDEDSVKTSNIIRTKFTLNVYTTSSEESPIPIYDYSDLCNMQNGGYYILLNDITLPNVADEANQISAFTPLSGNFASFDGNGHAINFAGSYDMGSATQIGLFKTLNEGSIIKNLVVNYTSSVDGADLNTNPNDTTYGLYGLRTTKFITTADSFMFGSIVAENSGIITNCQVYTETKNGIDYYLTVKADNALTGASYIGGIVGRNSGFVTNCGVSIKVKAPFNIGGVVAQNYNKVAACYFKEGQLINNSQFSQYVGGFAVTNSLDGQILTSYVSGAVSEDNLYSKDPNSYITSTITGAGFVLENAGKINDCYTNIDLSKTTSEMAGFVYMNGGSIKNCFSLSTMRNNTTASAGFAKQDFTNEARGVFVNCYYYYHDHSDCNSSICAGEGNINTSLYDVTYAGVEKLNRQQFANYEQYFSDYSYENGLSVNSVWFAANGNTSNNFVEFVPTTEKVVLEGNDGNTQSNTVYKEEIMNFANNRLELVSPNVRALSIRNFAYSEVDDATGIVTYHYIDETSTPNRGSLHNPRLIHNAKTMENEILNETPSTNLNVTNYRIISDISYSEFEGHSSLYKVKFAGILEGNGMKVSAISLVSMDELSSAGMFAQVGHSASKQGSVKNLTISPRAVSFNNTNSVGILAGTLKYGYVYDVTTEAVTGSTATVTGLKFVGGVLGKAVSSFIIKDVYSYANVSATFSPTLDIPFTEGEGNESGDYSYAGSIAGFVGNGKLYNAHVNNVQSVMGGRAGFAYGGIGRGADVRYTFVDVRTSSTIKAYQYGGYIAGEVSGQLTYSHVSNNNNDESSFSNIPKIATAVGGIAGRLNGGIIKDALMEQAFRLNANENNQTVAFVGGIVGIVNTVDAAISKIEDCVVTSNIAAGSILGGAVGRISSATLINTVAVKSNTLNVSGQRANPCLGGIVGSLVSGGSSSLEMSNSYCTSTLKIATNTSGIQSIGYAGGLIADARVYPRLYYCYTTSYIDAEIYDSRQISDVVDYSTAQSASYKDYVSYEHSIIEGIPSSELSSYPNVFYWGANVGDYTPNFVNFDTKAKSVLMQLNVTNFGAATTKLFGTESLQTSSLNDVFGKDYQIAVSQDKILNLTKIDNGFEGKDGAEEYKFIKNDIGEYIMENIALSTEEKTLGVDSEGNEYPNLIEIGDGNTKTYYVINGIKYQFIIEENVLIPETATYYTRYHLKRYESSYDYIWNGNSKQFECPGQAPITWAMIAGTASSASTESTSVYKRIEFKQEGVERKTVYRADDGNYYLKSFIGLNKYSVVDIKTGNEANMAKIKLEDIAVWKETPGQLSTLNVEDQFDWLNMT